MTQLAISSQAADVWIIRSFFAFVTLISVIACYPFLFDRDLMRRISIRFFETLLGQGNVQIPRSNADQPRTWPQTLFVFGFHAIAPMAWLAFEIYFAR